MERELPPLRQGTDNPNIKYHDPRVLYSGLVTAMEAEHEQAEALTALTKKLASWGMELYQVQVLVAHDILRWTFKEIMEEYGWVSTRAVSKIYVRAKADAKVRYEKFEKGKTNAKE